MPEPRRSARRRAGHRELIHELNQRYHREWVRAEHLANELAVLRAREGRTLLGLLRRLKRLVWPSAPPSDPPLAERATPYEPPHVGLPAGRVSIVIPFRDRPELLRNCLRSLRWSSFRRFEVVLVDNGSTNPRTQRLLARLADRRRYRVVSQPGGFNFARLCNAGAERARGEFLLFLNNDTEVLTPDWLGRMLAVAADPRVGVVGATLLYPDRTIQHAGLFPRADGTWVHPYRGEPEDTPGQGGELLAARCVPAVTAACLLVRRGLFADLGGFDERYPTTFNDVDLCRRVRDRGKLVVVTPAAKLLHYESLSRGFAG